LLDFIRFLVAELHSRGVELVEVFYGWAWALEVFDWESRIIPVDRLEPEIREVEALGVGSIGDDDLEVVVAEEGFKATLCHESDIHVELDPKSDLGKSVVSHLATAFETIRQEAMPFHSSLVWLRNTPTFIVSTTLSNESGRTKTLVLERAQETLQLVSGKELTVLAYASIPGMLEAHDDGETITIRSWESSEIRVLAGSEVILDTAKQQRGKPRNPA
jgi:hypothetical protein